MGTISPALLTGMINAFSAQGNKTAGTSASSAPGTAASTKQKEPTRAEKKAAQEFSDTIARGVGEAEAFTGAKFSQDQIDAVMKQLEETPVTKQARDLGLNLQQYAQKMSQDAQQLQQQHLLQQQAGQAEMDEVRTQLNDLMTAQANGEEVDPSQQKILTDRLDQLSAQADKADTEYQDAILEISIKAYKAGYDKKLSAKKAMAQLKAAAATEAAGRPEYKKRKKPDMSGYWQALGYTE